MTSMPTEIDADSIEDQGELDFGALFGHEKVAQKICTEVDNDTVAVEHCENEEELIYAYISSAPLVKLKRGPKQVEEILAVMSTGYIRGKRCLSLHKEAPHVNSTLRTAFRSVCNKIVLG